MGDQNRRGRALPRPAAITARFDWARCRSALRRFWGLTGTGTALPALVLVLLTLLPGPAAAERTATATTQSYRCDGTPLVAMLHNGAVDDPSIPNASDGTLPGAFVQLQWQLAGETLALQLPRTNNNGAPSFTDGRWWWSLEDPAHPRFRRRRGGGEIQDFACQAA